MLHHQNSSSFKLDLWLSQRITACHEFPRITRRADSAFHELLVPSAPLLFQWLLLRPPPLPSVCCKLIPSYARDRIASSILPNALVPLVILSPPAIASLGQSPFLAHSSRGNACFLEGHGIPVLGKLDRHMHGFSGSRR